LATATRELQAQPPNYDAVCFHAQQCAEKYLKSVLQERMRPFPKTHDLELLLDLLDEPGFQELQSFKAEAKTLSDAAVESRYPGMWADERTALNVMEGCKRIRGAVRASFSSRAPPRSVDGRDKPAHDVQAEQS